MEDEIIKRLWNPTENNIFWFERNLDSYIIIDGNYYYCFDIFYFDKIYNGELSKQKLNFLKDFLVFKKLIFSFVKLPKKEVNFSALLERYLQERIKMNHSILLEILSKEKNENTVHEYLFSFVEKYFDHEK